MYFFFTKLELHFWTTWLVISYDAFTTVEISSWVNIGSVSNSGVKSDWRIHLRSTMSLLNDECIHCTIIYLRKGQICPTIINELIFASAFFFLQISTRWLWICISTSLFLCNKNESDNDFLQRERETTLRRTIGKSYTDVGSTSSKQYFAFGEILQGPCASYLWSCDAPKYKPSVLPDREFRLVR